MMEVIYFLLSIVCLFNLIWIYFIITEQKMKFRKINIIIMLICNIVLHTLKYLNITMLKTTFLLISLILNAYFLKKNKLIYTIFFATFVWIFAMIYDFVFMLIFSIACEKLGISLSSLFGIAIMYFASLLLQLIYNVISRQKFHKSLANKLYNIFLKVNKYSLGVIVIILGIFGATCVNNMNEFNKVLIIILITFFALIIIIEFLFNKYLKITNIQTNKLILENNQFYIDLNLDTRMFKHNLIHKLDSIKSCGDKKVNLLVDDIMDECSLLKCSEKELDKLPNGLNGFIQKKLYPYKDELNVVVENDFSFDIFDIIKARSYNKLCEVVGVTLDNALEALKTSDNKVLYINVEDEEEVINIVIQNSFSSMLDMDRLGSVNYTTKGRNHGAGLFSILFNNSVKTKIRIINDMFETKITIKKVQN